MAINWDPIISGIVLILCGLWVMAKFTKQTIPEMLKGFMELINGTKDDVLEKGEELIYND